MHGGTERARQPVNAYGRFIPAIIDNALHVVQQFAAVQHRDRVAKGKSLRRCPAGHVIRLRHGLRAGAVPAFAHQ